MDVNLGPGRTGRIGLHAGDQPELLAANFARAYGLDDTMRFRLQGLIYDYMAEVAPPSSPGPGGEGAAAAAANAADLEVEEVGGAEGEAGDERPPSPSSRFSN